MNQSDHFLLNYLLFQVYPVTKDSMSNRIALLINNIDFNGKMPKRNGAEQDQQAMLKLLGHLQYEVVLHQDLTAEVVFTARTCSFTSSLLIFQTGQRCNLC